MRARAAEHAAAACGPEGNAGNAADTDNDESSPDYSSGAAQSSSSSSNASHASVASRVDVFGDDEEYTELHDLELGLPDDPFADVFDSDASSVSESDPE